MLKAIAIREHVQKSTKKCAGAWTHATVSKKPTSEKSFPPAPRKAIDGQEKRDLLSQNKFGKVDHSIAGSPPFTVTPMFLLLTGGI